MKFFVLTFVDVDECASPEANDCHSSALCTNTEGSYVCRCLRGYGDDGRSCTGINCKLYSFLELMIIFQLIKNRLALDRLLSSEIKNTYNYTSRPKDKMIDVI